MTHLAINDLAFKLGLEAVVTSHYDSGAVALTDSSVYRIRFHVVHRSSANSQRLHLNLMKKTLVKLVMFLGLTICGIANSQTPSIFKDADFALGAKLIEEHKCTACHIHKVGGNGSAMYKPLGRINTPGFLRGMVEQCNTEMNLGIFPEEVTSIAAVLNREHYKFK